MVNLVPLDVPSQKASKQSQASIINSLRFSGAPKFRNILILI